jgi:hypothetical protein
MSDNPKCIDSYGVKRWYLKGKFHREDGPAVEWPNGDKEWWLNGERHREDGPAVEYCDGVTECWINNIFYPEKLYYKKLYELGKISYNEYIIQLI